jgi:hypothetical protein
MSPRGVTYHQKVPYHHQEAQCLKGAMSHQIIINKQRPIIKRSNHHGKAVMSSLQVHRPLENVEHSQSSGRDNLHESVLVASQYPPKDSCVNQACGYVQSIIQGGAHVVECTMKTGGKVHNSNTRYKVSHVNEKSIRYISLSILFKLHTSLQSYTICQV